MQYIYELEKCERCHCNVLKSYRIDTVKNKVARTKLYEIVFYDSFKFKIIIFTCPNVITIDSNL